MLKVNKLYQLLENSAKQFPDLVAVQFLDRQISYKELNILADTVKENLAAIGITNNKRVAVCAPKSIECVAAIFGILKSGAAYLPLDYSAPAERNKFIIENCEAAAIIIQEQLAENFKDEFSFVCKLADGLLLIKNNRSVLKESPDDLAYVLYTSGSTGMPKGVMYTNGAALEFINWSSDIFVPGSADRFSSHAPFHFDLSVFDLFVSIKHGASLLLIKEETAKQPLLLAQLISEQKISIWYSTPAILNMLSEFGRLAKYNFDNLRLVLFAGEVFPVSKFNKLREQIPAAEYYNLYGPTETNVCTYFRVPEKIDSAIPIGKCCEHYVGMIKDGELFISGKGIMTGYWNNKTNDPFYNDDKNTRWYKTGDLVTRDENGNYIFKGRRDRMVKRNGYRIELDEIETALD
ncbi:MAG: amino acid adenylation domain-containing protein, partial [Bacteroidia bacterium]